MDIFITADAMADITRIYGSYEDISPDERALLIMLRAEKDLSRTCSQKVMARSLGTTMTRLRFIVNRLRAKHMIRVDTSGEDNRGKTAFKYVLTIPRRDSFLAEQSPEKKKPAL